MHGGVWLVLHLDAKKRGSMEQQLVALARRLHEEGIPAAMVFARPPAAFPGDELRAARVDVRHLDWSNPAAAARRFFSWLAIERPALVHFHFIDPYSPYVATAKMSGAKVIVHDHVCLVPRRGARALLKLARGAALNRLVDLRAAVSEYTASMVRRVHGVPPDRICIIENAVDLSRFRGIDGCAVRAELGLSREKLVVSVARLDEEKGGSVLLRAMSLLDGDAHLALVGEGERERAWRELAASLGIAQRVHFLGLRNDVEQVLAASDVVVVPSQWQEAFGLAVVEGMAAGKPVVVTQSGAMPAIVEDAGLVVPRHDAVAMAEALQRVLADETLARRLAVRARRRAEERYGMDRYVDSTLEVYRRLLAGRAGRRAA
jgi:glycosyltransferase involved in cell wall biosynthesis